MVARTYVSQLVTLSLHQHAERDASAQPAFPIVFSPGPRTWNGATHDQVSPLSSYKSLCKCSHGYVPRFVSNKRDSKSHQVDVKRHPPQSNDKAPVFNHIKACL